MLNAFIFPGQGSQSVNMLADYVQKYPHIMDVFKRASDVLNKDLYRLTSAEHQDELNQTINTQPIMLTSSYAIWSIWKEQNAPLPSIMAGHSFGEYSALVCAEAISFEDGVRIAAKRGELMQNATAGVDTAMAAVMGLSAEELQKHCTEAVHADELIVEMVNFNAPTQIVISGHRLAVEQVLKTVKSSGGGKAVMLPVSVPAHSSLMKPSAKQLAEFLDTINIKVPSVPVIQNISAESYSSAEKIKDALSRQLYNPVLWTQTIEKLNQSADCLIEIGPGQVLTGINKRIDRSLTCHSTHTPEKLASALKTAGADSQ